MATGLPDAGLTPGATNPAVTPSTLKQTICKSGWTATIRPSSSYTTGLKRKQIAQYGFADTSLSDYEEDHLISLELGGSPTSPANLWPEPHHIRLADGTPILFRLAPPRTRMPFGTRSTSLRNAGPEITVPGGSNCSHVSAGISSSRPTG
jgi:hypothetical protein